MLLLLQSKASALRGQSIPEDELTAHERLRQLDTSLRDQREKQIEGGRAVLGPDGKQNVLFWQEHDRLSPLNLFGKPVLEYAIAHSGSREALACLSYILEYGEGEPVELYRSACNELIEHYRDAPELSVLCSYSTNALWLHEHERFLTSLRRRSTSPLVQAASTFYLSKLLDNCLEFQRDIVGLRNGFKDCGFLAAQPKMIAVFNDLEAMPTSELQRRRNELLDAVVEMGENLHPWAVERDFGRLNYEFSAAPSGQTFRDMAIHFKYEIGNLREGCLAPAFSGTLAQGGTFDLSSRSGKPTLILFSFKGCGACEAMYPALRTVQKRFSQDEFSVLAVVVDQELTEVTTAIDSGEITWPCVWDGTDGPIAKAYRVVRYPTSFLLDAEGRITARDLRNESELIVQIERVVKQETVTVTDGPTTR